MKNTLQRINSRICEAEEWSSELEDKMVDSLTVLWDNIKHTIIQIIGVPEEEEIKKGYEKILEEIIAQISPTWKRK